MEPKYFGKTTTELARRMYESVAYSLETGLIADPDLLLQVNRKELTVAVVDTEKRLPNCDYYAMSDLISEAQDGGVEPSEEAIARLTASYAVA